MNTIPEPERELFLLDGEMEIVLMGYDIYDSNRVKVLCECTAREYWVDAERLSRPTTEEVHE